MDRIQISERLFNIAVQRARAHGVQFGDGADADIQRFSTKAADEILRSSDTTISSMEDLIRKCESNFQILVDKMVQAGERIPGYQASRPNIIGEKTLDLALKDLCPLWPIC